MTATRIGLTALVTFAMGASPPASAYEVTQVDGEVEVAQDRTIEADTVLKFVGGSFRVGRGATLTINGSIDAPLQQIFQGDGRVVIGPGRVDRVFPQWWGARGDGEHDDTRAIQSAIDSVDAGVIYFAPGHYANTGLTVPSRRTLLGAGPGASVLVYTAKTGSCLTLQPDCAFFRLERLALQSPDHTDGCGVDGTNEYVRYLSMRDFWVTGFKTGVYIAAGMHITFDYGYVSCYGGGKANGTVAIKVGDRPTKKGCTTVTVRDVYLTNAEIDFYNCAAPCLMIRPIFETSRIGLDSYYRNTVISPFFAGNKEADIRLTDNGALFIGISPTEFKVIYSDKTAENRSSFIPDTFDSPLKLGLMGLSRRGEMTLSGKRVEPVQE